MTGLRTNEALLRALENSSPRNPSQGQLETQRLSFVMGSLDDENEMTREEVQSVLEKQDGRALNV